MSIEYPGGNRMNAVMTCDAAGCQHYLTGGSLVDLSGFGDEQWEPNPRTGWSTVESAGDRKHYCADHAAA